jgi:hypothetical protein
LPFTAKSALIETRKRVAAGAPSSTREIKSEIACAEDAEAIGLGHWITFATTLDPTK